MGNHCFGFTTNYKCKKRLLSYLVKTKREIRGPTQSAKVIQRTQFYRRNKKSESGTVKEEAPEEEITYSKRQLKELKEDIKEFSRPQFTSVQLTAILLTALGYMAGIMIYVEGIKSDSRVNTVKIENTIEQYKMINIIRSLT